LQNIEESVHRKVKDTSRAWTVMGIGILLE